MLTYRQIIEILTNNVIAFVFTCKHSNYVNISINNQPHSDLGIGKFPKRNFCVFEMACSAGDINSDKNNNIASKKRKIHTTEEVLHYDAR